MWVIELQNIANAFFDMLWFCQTRSLVCFPERIYTKRFSVTVSLKKSFPLTAGPVSNPGVCFQLPSTNWTRATNVRVCTDYMSAHCPFVLIKPESKQIWHWLCTCRISYTCEMSVTLNCRSWTASRIIEPVWILCVCTQCGVLFLSGLTVRRPGYHCRAVN